MNRKYKFANPRQERHIYQGPQRIRSLRPQTLSNGNEPEERKLEVLRDAVHDLWVDVQSLGLNTKRDVSKGVNLYKEVETFEADLIKRALQVAGGNIVRAAQLLEVKYTTLHSKVQRYGLNRDTPESS